MASRNHINMGIWDKFKILEQSEEEILANKKRGRIYVADFSNGEGKYVSVTFDDKTEPYDINLQVSPRIDVRLTYIIKEEKITGVQISKLSNGKVEKMHLSTFGFKGILGLLQIFSELDLKSITNRSIILDSSIVKNEEELRKHLVTILADENGLKIISELAASKGLIAEGDIGNISKKKESLELFKNLLFDDSFFAEKKKEWNKAKNEDVWQKFFEDNKWIFGYGLEYVFNAPISKEKFEQTIKGSNFTDSGKRPDGILKTLGMTQFLNIVEIKTHEKKLLNEEMYRTSKVWQISSELVGAVSQCQQYVRTSIRNLDEFFDIKDDKGNRTSEEVFSFSPKCFLIIGDMRKEFSDKDGRIQNPDKLSCFEYFRKNILIPEIITFDQLYFRAKNIIDQSS